MNNIEIRNLSKKYPRFHLDDINLDVPKGAIIGLIGENGAGKTTLIKSILSIIKPDSGSIKLFGNEVNNQLKGEIGVVLDGSFFAEILKVSDIDPIMKNIYINWDKELFNNYLDKFKIPSDQTINKLSKGMRKKLEIITALSHHPKLLILDEPTSGLDPVVRNDILDIFLDFIQDEEKSVLLSTHITSDLEHVADYITLIDAGKVIFSQTKDEILDNYGIVKCDDKLFEKIDSEDIIKYKKNRYNYDILINDRKKITKKYKDLVVDRVSIEDIMLLYIKGVKE